MQAYLTHFTNLPSFLFFFLWLIFPVWLAIRRRQGLIRIERWNREEGTERIGRYFELGVFIFAIPFTCFFLFVTINFLSSYFVPEPSERFKVSVEITSLIMDIGLILYMYFVERKIHLNRIKRSENSGVDD